MFYVVTLPSLSYKIQGWEIFNSNNVRSSWIWQMTLRYPSIELSLKGIWSAEVAETTSITYTPSLLYILHWPDLNHFTVSTDLDPQPGGGCNAARGVGGLTDVDSLVAGVEVVDAEPQLRHFLISVRKSVRALTAALFPPGDVRGWISSDLKCGGHDIITA